MFVHLICGEVDPEAEKYGKKVLCNTRKRNMDQKIQRDEARKFLKKQAKKIFTVSNTKDPQVIEGVTVITKVPEVYRAKINAC